MKVNYSVAFLIDGQWTEDYTFKRPLFSEAPLDESLDTGIVVDAPGALNIIPPFTLCRVRAHTYRSNAQISVGETFYWTGDRETEAVTLFAGTTG